MIERPELTDEIICETLYDRWGFRAPELTFLPIGNDSGAWVFRAGDRFVKVRAGTPASPTLIVSAALFGAGIRQVVAPLATRSGAMFAPVGDFSLILYPFVEGQSGMDAGLTDAQMIELGAVLRQIHEARLPEGVRAQVAQETFVPRWAPMVYRLDALIQQGGFVDPSQAALAKFWMQRRAEIRSITGRCEDLGRMAAARNVPKVRANGFVLCHADIHLANVLVDGSGGLHIVDWEQPIFAPVERDLIFLAGQTGMGLVEQPREEALFLKGYGPVEIDRLTMAYYSYEWVVQEFGDYGERVFLKPDAGEATRAASVQGFIELFNPGDVVESALLWDKRLSTSG